LHTLDQESLSSWRGRSVGIVFQFFQLLPSLTIAENVTLPPVQISESGYLPASHKNKYGKEYSSTPEDGVTYPGVSK